MQYVRPPAGCERTQYRSAVITLFVLYVIALAEESALIGLALRGMQKQWQAAGMTSSVAALLPWQWIWLSLFSPCDVKMEQSTLPFPLQHGTSGQGAISKRNLLLQLSPAAADGKSLHHGRLSPGCRVDIRLPQAARCAPPAVPPPGVADHRDRLPQ